MTRNDSAVLSTIAADTRNAVGVPLGGIFSHGRSGSTWLGALLNSHPDIAYRFEPFNPKRGHRAIMELRRSIESGRWESGFADRLYEVLKTAHPRIDKPPFFTKSRGSSGRLRALPVKQTIWTLLSRGSLPQQLFSWAFTPRGRPLVVFKDIGHTRIMRALVERGSIPVIYLVRHPCGVVASKLRGQRAGLMPTRQFDVLESLVEQHSSRSVGRFSGRTAGLSPAAKNALLWRLEVENGVEIAERNDCSRVVVYERLCSDTESTLGEVLEHFGVTSHGQVHSFLRHSTRDIGGSRRGERFIHPYFSVYRDPAESSSKWLAELSREEREDVYSVVSDSHAFWSCATSGEWRLP